MEFVPGVQISTSLPRGYDGARDVASAGFEFMDALSEIHGLDWEALGLADFGRPVGFLSRQVDRWTRQFERNALRHMPEFHRLAGMLGERLDAREDASTLIHGDFHLDNVLYSRKDPNLLAIVDWEMATIGHPLIDLGLSLGFWGHRPIDPPAFPNLQAISRIVGAPSRWELAEHYSTVSGRDVHELPLFMALAFFKLAAIVEGAYSLYCQGRVESDYASGLESDVPRLVQEALAHLENPWESA